MGADGLLDSSNGTGGGIGGRGSSKFRQQLDDSGWENVPPYRQLKVLLVEDDDSTRHVVGALLRNCGYQVVSATNGLQAWNLLDERNREFDLVLTDVVMPGLSGIGLLLRIMHHESLKKIPVVMMSSHDATHVVFKCLSKGAADFLVKPVRKNELKNLWQHSWRRFQSSSGSESEAGRLNSGDETSRREDVHLSDQSDNGSAQSSCTRKVVEPESPPKLSKKKKSLPTRRGRRIKDSDTLDDFDTRSEREDAQTPDGPFLNRGVEASDAEASKARAAEELEFGIGGSNSPEAVRERDASSPDPATSSQKVELSLKSSSCLDVDQPHHILNTSGPSAFSRYQCRYNSKQQRIDEHPREDHQYQQQQMFTSSSSVQHPGQICNRVESGGTAAGRANESAAVAAAAAAAAAFFGRPDPQHGIVSPMQYAALLPYGQSLPARGTAAYYYAQPALPPWQHAFSPPPPPPPPPPLPQQQQHQQQQQQQHRLQSPELEKQKQQQQQRNFQAFNILAHHHHYHIGQHHLGCRGGGAAAEQETTGCGSTNGAGDGNGGGGGGGSSGHGELLITGGNNGLSGSVCGSNHGSNNYNGASNLGSGDLESNNCGVPVDDNIHNNNDNNDNNNNNSRMRREAALNKFRQKRKERCFEKKVRYQSRKRLAEQRPRVRGQFVSQAVYDSSVNNI